MSYYFSPLRLIAGFIFVLAGLFAYYGFRTDFALPVVLIVAGGALVLVVLTRRRPSGGDIALLVIALLAFGLMVSGPSLTGPRETITYSASRSQANDVNQVVLNADASFGSITILFSDNESLAYRVESSRSTISSFFRENASSFSFSNQTRDGTLLLNMSSTDAEIRVTLGRHYITSLEALTGTGSITLTAPRTERVEKIVLKTGTGSINAEINAQGVKVLTLSTGTGSIHLKSDHLAAAGAEAPFTVSTGTGSVNIDMKIPRSTSATLTASTNLGTVSHSLQGFIIAHSSNNRVDATTEDAVKQENSFRIRISTGTGSIDLKAARLTQAQL